MVSTVYGSEGAREALLGQVRQVDDWEPLLDRALPAARRLRRAVRRVRLGRVQRQRLHAEPPGERRPRTRGIPTTRSSYRCAAATDALLGILSVDEPVSGRKPSGDEIDVLVAVSEHAAIAVEAAQETARAKANRDALERLLDVSARLNETWDAEMLLVQVCNAISEALGFDKVARAIAERRGQPLHRRRGRIRGQSEHRVPRSQPTSSSSCCGRSTRSRAATCSSTRRPARSFRTASRAIARSSTAGARTRGRTTGCSCRSTIAALAASATSGPTIRSIGCAPTPTGCRSSAPSRTRP